MDLRGKRVLITGGAGFIGSELSRQLCEHGAEVLIVDNLVNGNVQNVAALLGPRCRLERMDIRDEGRMPVLLQDVNIVLHLACLGVRHSIHSPLENHEVNATATLKLLKSARTAGVTRFVYVSSSEVYGTAIRVPMTEEHPAFPLTVYGASKLAGECYTRAYHRTYDYPTVVVRPFNTYGPRCHHEGDSGEVMPKFILRCMAGRPMVVFGDGTQTRDFTYVSDTARGIIMAGLAEAAIGQTINIASGFEITVNALAEEIRAVLHRPEAPVVHDIPRPGDVLRLYAETIKARELIGFQSSVTLREGLVKLHDWYLSQGIAPAVLLKREVVHNWEGTPPQT